MNRPQFQLGLTFQVLNGARLAVRRGRAYGYFKGQVFAKLAPLLAKNSALEELLALPFPVAEIFFALELLAKHGLVVEGPRSTDCSLTNFWGPRDDDQWRKKLAEPAKLAVTLRNLTNDVGLSTSLEEHLVEVGIEMKGPSEANASTLLVTLVNHYLHHDLESLIPKNQPCLLFRHCLPYVWAGPLFAPNYGACNTCLARRLQQREGTASDLAVIECGTVSSRSKIYSNAALSYIASQVASVALGDRQLAQQIVSLDLTTWKASKHKLNGVCVGSSRCTGAHKGTAAQTVSPSIKLEEFPISSTDGGFRIKSTAETLTEYSHHISEITGLIDPFKDDRSADPAFSVHFGRVVSTPGAKLVACAGKGVNDVAARASLVCESLERHSAVYREGDCGLIESFEKQSKAISPNSIMLFSDDQYRTHQSAKWQNNPFFRVPQKLDVTVPIAWTSVWSLTNQREAYVPTALCYLGYPKQDHVYAVACTNGLAAGNCVTEAILQGLLELIERDAIAVWWYNRLRVPAIVLSEIADWYLNDVLLLLLEMGRTLTVLDVSHDLPVYVYVAVSTREQETNGIMLGFGAHLDPKIARRRAVSEMLQMLAQAMRNGKENLAAYESHPDIDTRRWLCEANVTEQSHLLPSSGIAHDENCFREPSDLADAVRILVNSLRCKEIEVLVLDLTRRDVGLPVVRVIAPGLRHFWPRFGPGRLYDLPVQHFQMPTFLEEHDLNPTWMFL